MSSSSRTRPRPKRLLSAVFVLALVLALLFAVRLTVNLLHWPADGDGRIEGWMPVGYVARAAQVPRDVLAGALGLDPGASPRQSIARLAAALGETEEEVIARLEAAILAYRASGDD